MKTEPKKQGRPAKRDTLAAALKKNTPSKRKTAEKEGYVNVHDGPPAKDKPEIDTKLSDLYRKLTKGQLDFVHNFIQADFRNATECYCNAFPESTREAANSSAAALLASPSIRAIMAIELETMMAEARIPLEKRLFEQLLVLAFYDPTDIVNDFGDLADPMAILKQKGLSICIEQIDKRVDKDGGEHPVYILADRTKSRDTLQKYIQMIKQPDAKVKGTGPDGQAFAFTVEFLKPNEKE